MRDNVQVESQCGRGRMRGSRGPDPKLIDLNGNLSTEHNGLSVRFLMALLCCVQLLQAENRDGLHSDS